MIIIDTPPCLASTDAAALTPVVSQIVFVIEAGRTQRTEIELSVSLISGCRQISFLLNKAPTGSSEHFGSHAYYYRPEPTVAKSGRRLTPATRRRTARLWPHVGCVGAGLLAVLVGCPALAQAISGPGASPAESPLTPPPSRRPPPRLRRRPVQRCNRRPHRSVPSRVSSPPSLPHLSRPLNRHLLSAPLPASFRASLLPLPAAVRPRSGISVRGRPRHLSWRFRRRFPQRSNRRLAAAAGLCVWARSGVSAGISPVPAAPSLLTPQYGFGNLAPIPGAATALPSVPAAPSTDVGLQPLRPGAIPVQAQDKRRRRSSFGRV